MQGVKPNKKRRDLTMNNIKGIEILNKDDMELVTGGSISLPMNSAYLNKNTCLVTAQRLIDQEEVTGMTRQEIAEEIYAHAVLFYTGITVAVLKDILDNYLAEWLAQQTAEYLLSHCNPIDIADGGDVWYRQVAFTVIWQVL